MEKGLKALNSLNFTVDPTMSETGHPQAQIRGDNVRVNPKGGLLIPDGVAYAFVVVESTKTTRSFRTVTLYGAEARAFGQLHEAGHKAKRFGKTDNDGDRHVMNSYENNYKIWKACFSDTPSQPWTGQPGLYP
jgi:hypothetical protein